MKSVFQEIKGALKKSRTALITGHIDPDGDAIGCMLALGFMLNSLGVKTDYYSEDGVPKVYKFLPGADKIRNRIDPNSRYDILFAVDSSDLMRLGKKVSPKEIVKLIVNIDHHPDNTNYGHINLVGKFSSTAELIYKLAKALKIEITREIAENLYVGLITDTGNFRYENTSPDTFVMAGDLIHSGVDTHALTTRIYDNKSVASIRLRAAAMSQFEISSDRRVAWTVITREMMEKVGAKNEDLIGLVDILRSIEGIEVAVLFREDEGKVKINFRSKERLNVSEIAKRFGGGGHIKAAGAVVEGELSQVKPKVIAEVLKYLEAAKFLV